MPYLKGDAKFPSAKFKRKFIKVISNSEFKDKRTNSVDLDEVAHYEPLHRDLHSLQNYLLSSMALEKLNLY